MIITKDKAMIPENEWDEGYIKGYADSARDSYYTWEKNQHRWHDATQEKPTEVCEVYIYFSIFGNARELHPFKHSYGIGIYIQENDTWYIQGVTTQNVIVRGWKKIEPFEIDE